MSSVLVVDDTETERDFLATVLRYAGHTVQVAASAEEALGVIPAARPDLIMVDILMPAMDGYSFVRKLRRDPAGAQIPVIFCTATYGDHEVRRLAGAVGVSRIMVKPYEPEEIVRTVADALEEEAEPPTPLPSPEFAREHIHLLNAKLLQTVDELKESKQRAAETLTLLETLLETAPVGFGFVDRGLRMVRINDTLAAINGHPVEDQLGRTVAEVVPELWPMLEPVYRHVLETGEAIVNQTQSGRAPSAPGDERHWLTSYYPVRLEGEIIGVGLVVVDVTEQRRAEEFRAAVVDNMVEGLYAMDGDGRISFVNAAASEMLGWASDELCGKPAHATIHYRHPDGSPFVEETCEIRRVRMQGESITIANDAFIRKDGTTLPVAYSAGPLAGPSDRHGTVVVFRDITQEQAERLRVQRELESLTWVGRTRDALDEGRLVLWAQPILPLTGGVPSEELLLRMIGRDGEVIPPGRFLPAAERFGLITEIDQWVASQAIDLAASGRHVEANLSGESIGSVDLLACIEQQLHDTGADPGRIVFEITETALMRDIDAGQTFATRLVELGCSIALDDFGTGFGGFTYLKRLPIMYLKIDIEFVRHLESNSANQHLVKAIVSIARGLGHRTIAEGVEDDKTLELLRDYGVDFAQGYHIGRPAPAQDFLQAHAATE